MTQTQNVIEFWFGKDFEKNPLQNSKHWFEKNTAFDAEIRSRFEAEIERAKQGLCEDWKRDSLGRLAFIILLDQFSRNIYRDTPRMFSQDALALAATLEGIQNGDDKKLHPIQRTFFYLPLEHSEDLEMQKKSLEMFRKLVDETEGSFKKSLSGNYDYAQRHRKIIERFGRFPHRNAILGRISTPEEIEFLKEPGSSF